MTFENKRLDLVTPSIVIALMSYGLLVLRSAVLGIPGNVSVFHKQIIWDLLAIPVMFAVQFFREKTIKDAGVFLYALSTFLLILVLFVSPHRAKRWMDLGFATFQPSELSKLSLVLLLPAIMLRGDLKSYLFGLAVASFHSLLVILEPDLGTAVLLLFIWFAVSIASRVKLRYVIVTVLIALLILPLVYAFGLKDYQKERIMAFLDPEAHARGAAYNVVQSMNAIGSGGLFGRGYMRGPANLYGFVPVDHTDFIIAVVGEELGFLGVLVIISLYSALLYRIYKVYERVEDGYWKLVMVGTGAVIFFHVAENLSMCVGLSPVTGIPLPFVSYGGSSTMIFALMIGIVMKVHAITETGKIVRR